MAASPLDLGFPAGLALLTASVLATWLRLRQVARGCAVGANFALMVLAIVVAFGKERIHDESVLALGIWGVFASAVLVVLAVVTSKWDGDVSTWCLFIAFLTLVWTAIISSLHTTELNCRPTWSTSDEMPCPFGEVLLGDITRPYIWAEGYPGLSAVSVAICVGYSLVTFAAPPAAVFLYLRAATWETRSCRPHRWDVRLPLEDSELWRLRQMQEASSLLLFSLLTGICKFCFTAVFKFLLLVNPEQRWFYVSPKRPPRSCVITCAMPNGQSLWACGLLIYGFVTLCFRVTAPHLMAERPGGLPAEYTEQQLTGLGLHPITTRVFFRRCFALLALLGPVPLARILLDDASLEQSLVGCLLGAVLAAVYHMGYIVVLRDVGRATWLRRQLLKLAVLLERFLCCAWLGLPWPRADVEGGNIPLVDVREVGAPEPPEPQRALFDLDANQVHLDMPPNIPHAEPPGFEFLGVVTQQELEGFRTTVATLQAEQQAAVAARARFQREREEADRQRLELRAQLDRELGLKDFISRLLLVFSELKQGLTEATSSGDLGKLGRALSKHEQALGELRQDADRRGAREAFDSFAVFVEGGHQDALQTFAQWHTCLDALRRALDRVPRDVEGPCLEQHADAAFCALLAAVDSRLDVTVSAEAELERLEETLIRWQSTAPERCRELIRQIIRTVTYAKPREYGDFCFPHLDNCLRLVCQARDAAFGSFEAICRGVVQGATPADLWPKLRQLQVLISFIGYLEEEDLQLCRSRFRELAEQWREQDGRRCALEDIIEAVGGDYCGDAIGGCSGTTLLQERDVELAISDPAFVIREMERRQRPLLGKFKDIFVHLAQIKFSVFKVIMVPHHVQMMALLIFKRFLEEARTDFKAVIARVGTGEGKSMLIAALAAYVAWEKGQKVHVVGSRHELVARDFEEFEPLFAACGLKPLLLTPNSSLEKVWEHHIVYCTPIELVMIYKKAAMEGCNFEMYARTTLLLDEIDVLVVDKDPNDTLVFPNRELGLQATAMAKELFQERRPGGTLAPQPAEHTPQGLRRAVRELWRRAERFDADAALRRRFALRRDGTGYVALDRNGEPDPDLHSNQLEVLNFRQRLLHGQSDPRPMVWFEPLFVMSKPHIFRKYANTLGFSGTLGNLAERRFVAESYQAAFLDVPEFLTTCTKTTRHTVQWVQHVERPPERRWPRLFSDTEEPGPDSEPVSISVQPNEASQLDMVARVALRARRHVPVLVIAKDAEQGRRVISKLRQDADQQNLDSRNVVLDLTRLKLEDGKREYNTNLSASTRPVGVDVGRQAAGSSAVSRSKQWRVTVTDSTGGRGTDYRMDDQEPDEMGGLLIIAMYIPLSQREWKQYKGRSGRQHWRGQVCAVLRAGDYPDPLPAASSPDELEDTIRRRGEELSHSLLLASRSVLVAGIRTNELCEELHMRGALRGPSRDLLPEFISGFSRLSLEEMERRAGLILGQASARFAPTRCPDSLLRSYEPDLRGTRKTAVVALDVSGSMGSLLSGSTEAAFEASELARSAFELLSGNPGGAVALGSDQRVARILEGGGFTIDRLVAILRGHEDVFELIETAGSWTASLRPGKVLQTTRLDLCSEQALQLIDQHFGSQHDQRVLVTFADKVQLRPIPHGRSAAAGLLRGLRTHDKATRLFDAVWESVAKLKETTDPMYAQWLIVLTDGDNLVSDQETRRSPPKSAAQVKTALEGFTGTLVVITVQGGDIREHTIETINEWVRTVNEGHGRAVHIPVEVERDASAAIRAAFEEVDWLIDCAGLQDRD